MATDAVIEILDSVPADVANRLEKYGKAIDKARSSGIRSMIAIAENLRLAHDELANHGNGGFVKWVESRCGFSARSANRYLRVASVFGAEDCDSLSQSFTSEALYLLASETTPAGAVTAALASAKSGDRINLESAKELVSEYTVDEPAPEWELFPALEKLTGTVEKLVYTWPPDARSAMAARLRTMADDIESGHYTEDE